MEFKEIDSTRVDGLRITQRFRVSAQEIAFARLGLLADGREDLVDSLPIHGSSSFDTEGWCDRDAAELVVLGNLSLLNSTGGAPIGFEVARTAVESGLTALARGAEAAAERFELGLKS